MNYFGVIFLLTGGWQWAFSLDISSLAPDQILATLGLGSTEKTGDIRGSISGLLGGGFAKLGYIPIGEALARCEGSARTKVEATIDRLRKDGERIFTEVGEDLEARCRSYVEYAGNQCQDRVEGIVEKLQEEGRAFLTREQKRCGDETNQLIEDTKKSEEERTRMEGEREMKRLEEFYERLGEQEMEKARAEFEARMDKLNVTITKEFKDRGKAMEERIRSEFEAKGELLAARTELEYKAIGERKKEEITAEFEERGEKEKKELMAMFEERGRIMEIEANQTFTERAAKVKKEMTEKCTEMLNMACEDVEIDTESDDLCLDVDFFGKK